MKLKNLLITLGLTFTVGAGVGASFASKDNKIHSANAATVSKTRIVLELEDQCWSTSDSRDPILHIWGISVDSSMEYDTENLKDEMTAASVVSDLENGGANVRSINDDGSIDTGLTWKIQEGNYRYWTVKLPWYITGFTFKLHCGDYWAGGENTVTKHGSHMLYNYGSWNSWNTSLVQDASGETNTYNVTNYAITAASTGGVTSDGHNAQVKGNGGSYATSGNYFPRQKISLKATNGTYSSFDHWSAGNSTTSATTYDYVGTAAKTYTATFSDTRQKYTVVFKDEDGTTLETKTNVYQGSSVSPTTTPTKADDGGKHYTFDKWKDSSGNDKTSALANVQSDLTVYASYTMSYKAGRYATGSFGDCSWGTDGAAWLTNTGTQYEGQVTLEFGDEFKIAYYDGSKFEDDSFVGYDSILTTCGAFHYFSGPGNIVCYARGTYNLYYTDGDFGGGKHISIELSGSLNAEHLAAQLMGLGENPGHCGDEDRFPAMKAIFLGLSSTEKTAFQGYASSEVSQFKNAYDRYTAWARALGEKPWETGKVSNALQLSIFNNNSASSSVIIIVVIASLGILTAGAYYFFKKSRKTEE